MYVSSYLRMNNVVPSAQGLVFFYHNSGANSAT